MKIFISCVSSQFEKCREDLASDLRAQGHEVKMQKDFQQGCGTLIKKLENYVANVDRVIILLGDAYGFAAVDDACPAVNPPRSYTQWEYYFARGERLNGKVEKPREIYLYLANETYLQDHQIKEPENHKQWQKEFVELIIQSGKDRQEFGNINELCRLVLKDLKNKKADEQEKKIAIPASLGSLFKGREHFIKNLRKKIIDELNEGCESIQTEIQKNQVLSGLGGVGKTRLAIEYAHLYKKDYNALLFVLAGTPETLREELGNLVGPLALNIAEVQGAELEQKVSAAMRWLVDHPGWLLILDNVDTEDAATAVEALVSRLYGGHILITSRLKKWSAMVEHLHLDVLDENAAASYLLDRTSDSRDLHGNDAEMAKKLARRLGGLALALVQAGAYIASEECSFLEYLECWEAGDKEVMGWYDERLMNSYPRSAATTWQTTVESVGSIGLVMLRVVSVCALSPVPEDLFVRSADVLSEMLLLDDSEHNITPRQISSALKKLTKLSMLTTSTENEYKCISMHQVVADFTRAHMGKTLQKRMQSCLQACFCSYAPKEADRFENWGKWNLLIPHGEQLLSDLQREDEDIVAPVLIEGVALYYLGHEIKEDGVSLQRKAVELRKKRDGDEHPATLLAINDLAIMVWGQEGINLLEQILPLREKVHGESSEEALETAYNLAMLLPIENEMDRIEKLFNRCFKSLSVSHGRSHWRTLLSERELIRIMFLRGKKDEAIEASRRIIKRYVDEPKLGSMHKDTLQCINKLGDYLSANGNKLEAIGCYRKALDCREKVLGARHQETLSSFTKLVDILFETNKLQEAVECCRKAIEMWSTSIGTEHDHTIKAYNLLINLLIRQGNIDIARAEQVKAEKGLTGKKFYSLLEKHGQQHREVLEAEREYAGALRGCGYYTESEVHFLRSIDGLRKIDGNYSEGLAIALNNYALSLRNIGDLDKAKRYYGEALEIDLSIRAPDHPKIAHRKNNLALLHLMCGELSDAMRMVRDAWVIKSKSHDITSARILWTRLALACLQNANTDFWVGQLKQFMSQPELFKADNVDRYWEIQSVIDHLEAALPNSSATLLKGIWVLLNGHSCYSVDLTNLPKEQFYSRERYIDIETMAAWKDKPAISLELEWPD